MKRFITSLCALSILFACTQEEPAPIRVESIELDSEELELIEGNSISLVATILPKDAENQNVIWSSSNKAVASVKDGEVTAVSVGEAIITAKSEDGGKKATCVVTVNPKHIPVTAISLDKTEVAMNPENKEVLTATIAPENASNKSVLWSCSDESIATVKDGEVTALKVGEVVVTATSEDGGKKATCKVTVYAKPVPVTGVSLNKQKARVFINDELTLTATVAPEDATNKTLVWTTSNALVATVKNGMVKGISVGEADITVKTEDGNHSATCKVSVTEVSQTQTKGPLTLDLGIVTSTTATFNGVLDVDMLGEYDMNAGGVGFIYAPADQPLNIVTSSKVQISEVDSQGKFTHTLTGLKYNSEYHYAIFVYKNTICQYGETQVFETVPVDIELNVKDITQTRATIAGRLTLPENDKELEVGVLCSTSSDMTITTEGVKKAVVTDILDADGGFSHRAEELLFDNSYYCRYYVKQGDTYTYGSVQDFKTETVSVTLSVSDITQTTATFVGKAGVTEDGVVEIGVLYSDGVDLIVGAEGVVKQKIVLGSSGNASYKAEELQFGTTYNYCYYICQNEKYSYGEVRTFKTASESITLSVDLITQTTATFNGRALLTEEGQIEVGVLYSSDTEVVLDVNASGAIKQKITPDLSGNLLYKVGGLQHATTYNYCCYVCQNGKYIYGETKTFTTLSVSVNLSVSTTQTTVTFNGNAELTESGVIEVGVLYSQSTNLTVGASGVVKRKFIVESSGNFSHEVEGLLNTTTYNYCYYIYQRGKYTYGETRKFMTLSVNLSSDATQTTATFQGNVKLTGDDDIEVGVIYSTSTNLTIGASGITKCKITPDSSGNLLYMAQNLQYATTYYYCGYAIQKGKYTYSERQEFTTQSVSVNLSVSDVTQTTARFNGNVELTESGVIEVGVLYSQSTDLTVSASGVLRQKCTAGASGNLFGEVEGLQHGTTYNYCHYVYQEGKYTYGNTQTFVTQSASVALSVNSITETTATFSGRANLTEYGQIDVGVLYSIGTDLTIGASGVIKQEITPDSSGNLSCTVNGLLPITNYNFCYYIHQNGKYIYGANLSFTTLDHYLFAQKDLSASSALLLSSTGSANCYIISKAGTYKFPTVKGNSTTSVGPVSFVTILWESFGTDVKPSLGSLISGVYYKDNHVIFQTPEIFMEGNAVIAVKDSKGNILWSWHIWLTDEPHDQSYVNDAGTVMDRNLGATSSTPGDVGALGLQYQWGRKDPFLGSSSISKSVVAESTISWPNPVSASLIDGTLDYAITNPVVYITGGNVDIHNDWQYPSYDYTLWTESKTVYDPCPVGYRVPSVSFWSITFGEENYFDGSPYADTVNYGTELSGKFTDKSALESVWYPWGGYRNSKTGKLTDVGGRGNIWSLDRTSNYQMFWLRITPSWFIHSYDNANVGCALAYPVRCVKE